MLMREFEATIARGGEDVAVARTVLDELRKLARHSDDARPRADDAARHVFSSLEPFLVEAGHPVRAGQIRRASLQPIWQWLERDGLPDATRAFAAALGALRGGEAARELDRSVRRFQPVIAAAIAESLAPDSGVDRQRKLSRIGSPAVIDDMAMIAVLLQNRDPLEAFGQTLAGKPKAFREPQVNAMLEALNVPALQSPAVIPFALSMVMQHLTAPWQIIRLALKVAGSDDESKVSVTPYGVAVTMAIHDLAQVATVLRGDIKRGHLTNVAEHLKTVHDGVRGLRTELDIRNDSLWGRRLASIRVDISNTLKAEIESVPGRVRRLLRQRPDKDIPIGSDLDRLEIDEVAALIDFVAVCRTYASELAINEVTLRTYSDLQQYVEKSTDALVQAMRGADPKVRPFRQMQVQTAIRFCEVLFGRDYASLMQRAAENAMVPVELKSARAG